MGPMYRPLILFALVAACTPAAPLVIQNPALDFALLDVNPNSQTTGSAISPRDLLGGVSAWYFGSAT